ncbi:MAG: triose-phosphate isomerase [Thermovenabulum sp.]|uniref:triose-phosphate isomerase n=1 Tax=Thermovenabulum sp. TaxID=3100335 RepID=UPI003C7E8616
MRRPLIAGNWKMHNNVSETITFLNKFIQLAENLKEVEIVIFPPFTSLWEGHKKVKGTNVKIGAQNMHWEEKGAFTGEISPTMLSEIPCEYVIIGHSERRQYFAETDETVNKKVKAALKYGIKPVICVGESLKEREENITLIVVKSQVQKALKDIELFTGEEIVFAYEPIWAIGTGKVATPKDAQEVISSIRREIENLYGEKIAKNIRILYGGSVKPDNIKELMKEEDIDGVLVGGASIDPESFYKICAYKDQGVE